MSRWLILIVILLAAWLRWWQIDLVDYKYDEAHILGMAQGVAHLDGYLPIESGGTSLGLPRGAFDVYLLAVPLALTGGRVESAVWIIGALGVLAVALTYALAKRIAYWLIVPPRRAPKRMRVFPIANLWNETTQFPISLHEVMALDAGLADVVRTKVQALAVVAALYMAANPWLVYLDRKLWAHIQVFFSVWLLWLAWQVVVERRARAAFGFVLVASLQLFSHTLALVQGLSWLTAWLVAPRRWWNGFLLAGIIVGGLLLLPYVLTSNAQLQQNNSVSTVATNLSNLSETLDPPSSTHWFNSKSWQLARQFFAGNGLASVVGQTENSLVWWNGARVIAPLLLLLIGLGVVRIGWSLLRSQHAQNVAGGMLLLTWAIGPLLVFTIFSEQTFLQYWTVLLPLPALFLGIGVESLIDWIGVKERWMRYSALTLLSLLLLGMTIIWIGTFGGFLDFVQQHEGVSMLRFWNRSMQQVQQIAAQNGTNEVRVAVHGVDPGYESEPAVVATLIGNPPFARFVAPASPPALLFSYDRPSLYFVGLPKGDAEFAETERSMQQWGELVWQGELSRGELPARLYRLPAFVDTAFKFSPISTPPTFDAGMQLLGYRFPPVESADQPAVMTLIWRVLDPPADARGRDVTAFNHILTVDGAMAAQVDGLALLSRDWWPGDVLVQSYTVSLPAGEYIWRTGLYSRVDGGRSITSSGSDVVDLAGLVIR